MNPLVADLFLDDAYETVDRLRLVANGLAVCENKELAFYGYRVISFKKHHYKMIYRIKNDTVIIDGVYHDLQDLNFSKLTRKG